MSPSNSQLNLNFDGPLVLMTVDEIYERASVGLIHALLQEDRRIERKPAGIHPEALGDYFSMWANTAPDGGVIVIGMEDDAPGTVTGCLKLSMNQLNRLESTRIEYCADSRAESKRIEAVNDKGEADYISVLLIPILQRHFNERMVYAIRHEAAGAEPCR